MLKQLKYFIMIVYLDANNLVFFRESIYLKPKDL